MQPNVVQAHMDLARQYHPDLIADGGELPPSA
jgi:hypothetical protein